MPTDSAATSGGQSQSLGFDELKVGQTFWSTGRTLTEADIVSFAGLSGDFNPLHTDAEWVAANTDFRGRIAHGLLVLSISSGLRTPGLDELNIWAFLDVQRAMKAPTYPGDTIRAKNVVAALRPSKTSPGSGIVSMHIEVTNQRNEVVQSGEDVYLVGGAE